MKKINLLCMFTLLVGYAQATTFSNKTFLRPRPLLRNLTHQKTTWHKQTDKKDYREDGGTMQITGFFQASRDAKRLGRYFGSTHPDCRATCGSNGLPCDVSCDNICSSPSGGCRNVPTRDLCCAECEITDCEFCNLDQGNCCAFDSIQVDNTTADDSVARDLISFDVLHNPWAALGAANTNNTDAQRAALIALNLGGTVQLQPEYNAWGFRFDYHQDLNLITPGLYLRMTALFAQVETTLNPRLCNGEKLATTVVNGVQTANPAGGANIVGNLTFNFVDNTNKTVLDFLRGNVKQQINPLSASSNTAFTTANTVMIQDALTKLKFPCGKQSQTRPSDIEFMLGYNLIHSAENMLGLNVAFVIPTGNNGSSEYLFEPLAGNGDHYALGVGMDSAFQLWTNDTYNFQLKVALDYRYLFSSGHRRVVGVKDSSNKVVNHSWYRLLGRTGGTKVFPAANVMCCKMDVEPGSQLDFLAGLAFNYSGFTLDAGYNLFFQEKEELRLDKGCWRDGVYGKILDSYDPQSGTNAITTTDFEGGVTIDRKDLWPDVAATPEQVTHKFYGGMGYAATDWRYPVMFGWGGSYEWSEDNSAFDQWSLWAKLGVTF